MYSYINIQTFRLCICIIKNKHCMQQHSIHASIYLSIHPSIHLCIYLSIYQPASPSMYQYINLSIHPSTHLSKNLSIHSCIHIFKYLSFKIFIYVPFYPCIHTGPPVCLDVQRKSNSKTNRTYIYIYICIHVLYI